MHFVMELPLMAQLSAFWIVPPCSHGPIGFGVTAFSLQDALTMIRALGYGNYLPKDASMLRVTEDVTIASLDWSHVVANMGPIVVRGMWYPFVAVGLPRWAEDRYFEARFNCD